MSKTKLNQEISNDISDNNSQDLAIEVFVKEGKAITTSLKVAEVFKKNHRDVLRKIENLDCSREFTERNFTLSSYIDTTGRSLPM